MKRVEPDDQRTDFFSIEHYFMLNFSDQINRYCYLVTIDRPRINVIYSNIAKYNRNRTKRMICTGTRFLKNQDPVHDPPTITRKFTG